MKTRIHIHREIISGALNTKHFIVTIPRDAEEVIGIKISPFGIPFEAEAENHYEAGKLRITRDGIVLYETQLREDVIPEYLQQVNSPAIMENGLAWIAGAHNQFHNVRFDGQPRALFCKYEANKTPLISHSGSGSGGVGVGSGDGSGSYALTLYFLYIKKNNHQ
jgi:hypothetical protein